MSVIERNIRRIDAAQQRHTIPAFVFGVMKKFGDDNAGSLTVQMTYSLFVTVFPLLLLLITVLSIVLAENPSDRHRVLDSAFGQFPIVGQQLARNLHAMKRSSVFGIVVGLLGLLYGSTGLAQSGLYSMGQIWNIPSAVRPNYLTRMTRSLIFLVILAVGLIVTTALAGFGTFGRHNIALGILGEFLAVLVNVGLYFAAFRALTPKQVANRDRSCRAQSSAPLHGPCFRLLVVMWSVTTLKGRARSTGCSVSSLDLWPGSISPQKSTLYAAELNSVLFHRLWPRAMVQPPLTEADQRSLAFQATENQRRPEQVVTTYFRSRPMKQDEYRERGYKPDDSTPGIERTEPSENPASKASR